MTTLAADPKPETAAPTTSKLGEEDPNEPREPRPTTDALGEEDPNEPRGAGEGEASPFGSF